MLFTEKNIKSKRLLVGGLILFLSKNLWWAYLYALQGVNEKQNNERANDRELVIYIYIYKTLSAFCINVKYTLIIGRNIFFNQWYFDSYESSTDCYEQKV